MAVASCQRWEHGFYTAWADAAQAAPDLVLFLGDYIYEYAQPAKSEGLARPSRCAPPGHCKTIATATLCTKAMPICRPPTRLATGRSSGMTTK